MAVKNPTPLITNLEDDELSSFIDEIYDNKIDYDQEFDLGNGKTAIFSPSMDKYSSDFDVSIIEGDNEIDAWGDWYPIKRARPEAKASLIKRLRGK